MLLVVGVDAREQLLLVGRERGDLLGGGGELGAALGRAALAGAQALAQLVQVALERGSARLARLQLRAPLEQLRALYSTFTLFGENPKNLVAS